jgi:hypothetical protein
VQEPQHDRQTKTRDRKLTKQFKNIHTRRNSASVAGNGERGTGNVTRHSLAALVVAVVRVALVRVVVQVSVRASAAVPRGVALVAAVVRVALVRVVVVRGLACGSR